MPVVEIIGLPQSNFVWTARIACAEKGVEHVNVPAPPHTPEVAAIHPLGKMPVLRHGARTVFESRAILAYLDGLPGPALAPPDAIVDVEQWTSLVNTDIEPIAIRRYLFGYMFPKTPDGAPDRGQIDAAWTDLQPRLRLLEQRLVSGWLAGPAFTLADCYLIPILFYLSQTPEAGAAITASPALKGYLERGLARDSVRQTAPPRPS